jgi:EAL domain-containing protein (putative c-di-GMP-specific phosphodiesterase class I)
MFPNGNPDDRGIVACHNRQGANGAENDTNAFEWRRPDIRVLLVKDSRRRLAPVSTGTKETRIPAVLRTFPFLGNFPCKQDTHHALGCRDPQSGPALRALGKSLLPATDLRSIVKPTQNLMLIASTEIGIAFQPIYRLAPVQSVAVGTEALARWSNGIAPPEAFARARRCGQLTRLDCACVRAALRETAFLPRDGLIFLNVYPQTLVAPTFPKWFLQRLAQARVTPERVVVEIVERFLPADHDRLISCASALRSAGIRLALDDFGTGHSNLDLLLELRPQFVKLNAPFLRRARRITAGDRLLQALAEITADLGTSVVAEGIEDLADLEAVIAAGIGYGQGYYLARPAPAAETASHLAPGTILRATAA